MCSSLNTVDVLEIEAFIDGLEPSIKVINNFEKAVELNEKNQIRKPLKHPISRLKFLESKPY